MGKKCKISTFKGFEDFKLPPCAEVLGNSNPFIKDGRVIYKNNNRLYFFLSYNTLVSKDIKYDAMDPKTFTFTSNGNLQIEPYYFFIGIYINELQKGTISEYKKVRIHDDENADKFIKNILDKKYNLDTIIIPSLTYSISNSNAIIPLINNIIEISPLNYYIILMLSRFYGNYGLLFGDNSYVTQDYINYSLSNIYTEI